MIVFPALLVKIIIVGALIAAGISACVLIGLLLRDARGRKIW